MISSIARSKPPRGHNAVHHEKEATVAFKARKQPESEGPRTCVCSVLGEGCIYFAALSVVDEEKRSSGGLKGRSRIRLSWRIKMLAN